MADVGIMKTTNILASLIIGWACAAHAETNPVWNVTIPRLTFTNALLADVLYAIETSTRQQDPSGRGARIVCETNLMKLGPLTCDLTNIPAGEAVQVISETSGQRAFFFDDIAVVAAMETGPRRLLAFHGRCSDALTGQPIHNLQIESPVGLPAQVAVSSNGFYVCAKPIPFDYVAAYDGVEFQEMNGRDETITAYAPGYEKKEYKVPRRGGRYGYNRLDIELLPIDEKKEE
jgi:hypothetical protein